MADPVADGSMCGVPGGNPAEKPQTAELARFPSPKLSHFSVHMVHGSRPVSD